MLKNPAFVVLLVLLALVVGFWAGADWFGGSTPYLRKLAEVNRRASVPGLYFLAEAWVNAPVLLDEKGKNWCYVGMDFGATGQKVLVYEMQPGGRRYYFREGLDWEPRPYPTKFE